MLPANGEAKFGATCHVTQSRSNCRSRDASNAHTRAAFYDFASISSELNKVLLLHVIRFFEGNLKQYAAFTSLPRHIHSGNGSYWNFSAVKELLYILYWF